MRRQDLGGLVFESRNYLDPQQIASMAGEGTVIAADEGHVPPFVMVSQEGGGYSEFPDLPPAESPSEFGSVGEAEDAAADDLFWVSPQLRGIIPLEHFHVPQTLRQLVKQDRFEIRVNHDFPAVMRGCMNARRGETWINERLIEAYVRLNQLGFAHSV